MAVTATFEVGEANKTNWPLEESPDNDIVGIPSKPGVSYLRKPAMEVLAEENGGKTPKHIRVTFEVID